MRKDWELFGGFIGNFKNKFIDVSRKFFKFLKNFEEKFEKASKKFWENSKKI